MDNYKKVDGKTLGEALFGPLLKDLNSLKDALEGSIKEQELRIENLKKEFTNTDSSNTD